MDNLTHSLAGMTVAELILRVPRREVSRTVRLTVYAASIAANNFPDLDFLYTGITEGKLGYLLHHRGHTHTVIFAILMALGLYGAFLLLHRRLKWDFSPEEKLSVFAVLSFGPLLHIFLDSLNSYGVHPFWPFNNSWYYADTLFIVEPTLWVTAIPFLLAAAQTKFWRWVQAGLLALAYGLILLSGMVPLPGILFAGFLGGGALVLSRVRRPALQVSGLLGSWVAVVMVFFVSSQRAHRVFDEELAAHRDSTQLDELVLSPLPSNPFCWSLISAEREGSAFVSRRGVLAPYPTILTAGKCPTIRGVGSTARRQPAAIPNSSRIDWQGEIHQDQARFQTMAASCGAQAFLKFSRVPYFEQTEKGLLALDLRFDWENSPSFAEITFKSDAACPKALPDWKAPRNSWVR